MKKRVLLITYGALAVFTGALLVSGVGAYAQSAPGLSSDVNLDIRDYCDPTSFDAVLGDGACDRSTATGFITFAGFQAELGADKSVGAWRFAPDQISVAEGATLHVTNLGGETHTFTQVKDFGGGFVAPLNAASGNPVPAPECAQIVDGNLVPQPPGPDNIFLPAGASATVPLDQEVNANYQCCIHPWMRLTISPHDTHHTEVR
jgi:plastocyanin